MTAVSPPDAPASARTTDLDEPKSRDGTRDVELLVEGMTCAACAVRVEKKLGKLDGVRATVNYATATALVTAPAGLPMGVLTAAVERAGYAATAREEADSASEGGASEDGVGEDGAGERGAGEGDAAGDRAAGRDFAYLRRRLIVALVFFVPLTDLSLMLSLVPSLRFAGW